MLLVRLLAVSAAVLMIAACGQPRPVAEQGPVCKSMATQGHLPAPWPDLTPDSLNELHRQALVAGAPKVLADVKAANFRAKVAAQAAARRQMHGMGATPPTQILSVSAGGAWGAFSIGFLDGWGRNPGTD